VSHESTTRPGFPDAVQSPSRRCCLRESPYPDSPRRTCDSIRDSRRANHTFRPRRFTLFPAGCHDPVSRPPRLARPGHSGASFFATLSTYPRFAPHAPPNRQDRLRRAGSSSSGDVPCQRPRESVLTVPPERDVPADAYGISHARSKENPTRLFANPAPYRLRPRVGCGGPDVWPVLRMEWGLGPAFNRPLLALGPDILARRQSP
jgi:hypothetical protein